MKTSTNSNLNVVVHIFSFLFQSWACDICELLVADSSVMLYRNYALEAGWMQTNIAIKFLSHCFSFNFCKIFVFLLLKSTASTSSLLITVSVAWALYNNLLFLEKGGICGFTLCMYADYKAALTHDTLLHGLWFSPNIRHPSAVAWGTPPLTFYSLGSLPLKTSSLHWQPSAEHDVSAWPQLEQPITYWFGNGIEWIFFSCSKMAVFLGDVLCKSLVHRNNICPVF